MTLSSVEPKEYKEISFLVNFTPSGGVVSRSTSALVDIKAPGDSHPQFLQKTYQGQVEEEQSEADIVKVCGAYSSKVCHR